MRAPVQGRLSSGQPPSRDAGRRSGHGFSQCIQNPSGLLHRPVLPLPHGRRAQGQILLSRCLGRAEAAGTGSRGGRAIAAVPPRSAPCPCHVCSSECCVVVDPVDVSCSAEVPCSSVPRR